MAYLIHPREAVVGIAADSWAYSGDWVVYPMQAEVVVLGPILEFDGR